MLWMCRTWGVSVYGSLVVEAKRAHIGLAYGCGLLLD